MAKYNVIEGNLITLAIQGKFDVILHGCNCFNTMKSGIAGEIAWRLPEAVEADQQTKAGDIDKLGTYSKVRIQRFQTSFDLLNCYTQYRYGRDKSYVDYYAVTDVLLKVVRDYPTRVTIGIPLIGCGLAGGKWEIVSNIVDRTIAHWHDVTLVVPDLSTAPLNGVK